MRNELKEQIIAAGRMDEEVKEWANGLEKNGVYFNEDGAEITYEDLLAAYIGLELYMKSVDWANDLRDFVSTIEDDIAYAEAVYESQPRIVIEFKDED